MTNMQDLDDMIKMFIEESKDEDPRSAENRPKRKISRAGIERLVI